VTTRRRLARGFALGMASGVWFVLTSGAMATEITPAVRSEIAPSGKLRVGLNHGNFLLVTPGSSATDPHGVAPDIARELGKRVGVPVEFTVGFDDPVPVLLGAVGALLAALGAALAVKRLSGRGRRGAMLAGALFLGIVAVMPTLIGDITGVQTLRLGGTSILIVVGVVVETMKQLEAQLLQRSYEGFIR